MIWLWIGFILFVLVLLALDLGVFHRHAHEVKMKEALGWSAVWITLGLSFSVFVYFAYERHWFGIGESHNGSIVDQMAVTDQNPTGQINGHTAVVKYLTGYVIEKSLSVDNIFVIAMIFGFMAVPAIYQHRVLFWGILGALVMRGVMIGVGSALIARFHWILYIFAAFLIFTGIRMLFSHSEEQDPTNNAIVRWTRRLFPVTSFFHGQHFFVRAGSAASHEPEVPAGTTPDPVAHPTEIAAAPATPGDPPAPGAAPTAAPVVPYASAKTGTPEHDPAVEKVAPGTLMITPLFLALVLVEFTDLIFAVDSIPAIFAITTDPFLVFTSNVFAILGLRSLYFALAGMMNTFKYLKVALAVVLLLVGIKMLSHNWLKLWLGEYFNFYVLGVILAVLTTGVVASLVSNRRNRPTESPGSHAATV